MKRIAKTQPERVADLVAQLRKLREYGVRACEGGEEDFFPEVPTKLRLLVVRGGSNKPLLLDLANELGVALKGEMAGPPGFRLYPDMPPAGQPVPAEDFLSIRAVTIDTSDGQHRYAYNQFVRAWAEQEGGAHQDPTVEETLRNALAVRVKIGGLTPNAMILCSLAKIVLDWGNEVLAAAPTVGR